MAPWNRWILMLIQGSLLINLCKGALECACSTEECKKENTLTCTATFWCYVQFMPGSRDSTEPEEVRGCINDRTPLLCENRRPQKYPGTWPVLLCCKDDWCNKDAKPTLPPYLAELEDREHPNLDMSGTGEKGNTEGYKHIPSDESQNQLILTRQREHSPKTINPLYIAVPIAGACILLAIIIFAIYVLKRQNQYLDEYRYHSHLRQQQQLQQQQQQHQMEKNGVPADIKDLQQNTKKSMYTECERSSSGSETKLLMKV